MLTISQAMLDTLEVAMDEDRWRWAMAQAESEGLAGRLLSEVPEASLKRFAHQLGVFQPDDIMRLFGLIAEHGIHFYKLPWAAPFFYNVPFDYPHETLLHLIAQSQEVGREQPGH
jgi:hypothetical protein